MGQIRSNVVKKTKELVFQWVFFIFCMRYTFTSKKVVVIEIPEWRLKTILVRNTSILRKIGQDICPYWVKNNKK